MKKLLILLMLVGARLSSSAATFYPPNINSNTIAAWGFIPSTNGTGTNLTVNGKLTINGKFSSDASFFIGANSGELYSGTPGIFAPFGTEIQGQLAPMVIYSWDRKVVEYVGYPDSFGTTERVLRGSWHDLPVGNLIKQTTGSTISSYRNSGAPYDVYHNSYGGSIAASVGHQARGQEVWANQYKPFVIISTRAGDNSETALTNCNIATITNGVQSWKTNGFQSYFSNATVGVAYSIENGWLTNHRSSTGLLRWDTNRFPWLIGNDTMPTNLTTYLSTNGIEPWLLMYAHTYVPNPANWISSAVSELDLDPALNSGVFWEYPNGSNPFGAVEIQPCITFDTIHRDISSFYTWGVKGISIQDVTGATGSGYFDTLHKEMMSAILNPYFHPTLGDQILLDAAWNSWYPGNHAIILNSFMGNAAPIWPTKAANNVNGLYVETGGASIEPVGSAGIGWIMGQVRQQSQFLTNTIGYCKMIPGTDQANFNTYNYKDWKSYFDGVAFFNMDIWLTKANKSYDYFATANFSVNLTNATVNNIWQDAIGGRYNCLFLNATNSGWFRKTSDGSTLVWLVNESAGVSTNLTVNWSQLGFPAGVGSTVIEVVTNANLGVFTDSFTINVPTTGDQLLKFSPPVLHTYMRTNFISGQLYTNTYGGPIQVSAKVALGVAAVSGNAVMSLEMAGNETNQVGMSTLVTSIAMTYTNMMLGIVTNNGTYVFTNKSSGAGNTSTLIGGQLLIY